uniref:Resolvase/invertase-type recombinase catalytic domain-containing protein n=2 Tax=Macrostomum lignano TaxID=282301 RepID=A0A1I8G3U0_9PLAT
MFIVNQATASLMGHQVFSSLDELKPLLTSVTAGRLLILTSVQKFRRTGSADEAAALRLLGSSGFQIVSPKKPDMEATAYWVLIAFAKSKTNKGTNFQLDNQKKNLV